jgi:carbohydrate-binding DOMON domain-containing protein
MLGNPQKFKQSLFLLLFLQFSVWAMMIFTGCGGSGHIPSAGILTSSEVTLKWQDVPDAAAYNVYLSTSPGVTVLNSYKISMLRIPLPSLTWNPAPPIFLSS